MIILSKSFGIWHQKCDHFVSTQFKLQYDYSLQKSVTTVSQPQFVRLLPFTPQCTPRCTDTIYLHLSQTNTKHKYKYKHRGDDKDKTIQPLFTELSLQGALRLHIFRPGVVLQSNSALQCPSLQCPSRLLQSFMMARCKNGGVGGTPKILEPLIQAITGSTTPLTTLACTSMCFLIGLLFVNFTLH